MYSCFEVNPNDILEFVDANVGSIYYTEYNKLCSINENDFDELNKSYYSEYNEFFKQYKNNLELNNFNLDEIDSETLIEKWFPFSKFDIFISHHRNDFKAALKFEAFLKRKYKVTSFIDSLFWGYIDDLQKLLIDNSISNQEAKTHVDMLLSVSLTKMMDSCSVFIYFNPENSSNKFNYNTLSPWVFYELSIINYLQYSYPDYLKKLKQDGLENIELLSEKKAIQYSVTNSRVKKLEIGILSKLFNQFREVDRIVILFVLHTLYNKLNDE